LSVEEVRWELEEEPGEPLPNFAVNDAEAVYLDQIVELSTQLLSYRTMNQILLEQQRDQARQIEHCQTALRELRARLKFENP